MNERYNVNKKDGKLTHFKLKNKDQESVRPHVPIGGLLNKVEQIIKIKIRSPINERRLLRRVYFLRLEQKLKTITVFIDFFRMNFFVVAVAL
jgi:hypothetical protein